MRAEKKKGGILVHFSDNRYFLDTIECSACGPMQSDAVINHAQ